MVFAAKAAGRELIVLRAGDAGAIELAFSTFAERRMTALLVELMHSAKITGR